jgi:hypothetical protein
MHIFLLVMCRTLVIVQVESCIWFQDLDNYLAAAHSASLGKKKNWKTLGWQVLLRRRQNGTLTSEEWKPPPRAPSPMPASEWLGEPPDEVCDVPEEQNCGFPRQDPVEKSPLPPVVEADSEQDEPETTEISTSDMQRWSEMVECVAMLEQVSWLSDIAETPENAAALNVIFREGMEYCNKFMDGVLLPWNILNWPLQPRIWLGEQERTLKAMAKRGCLPRWLRKPHDKNIREDAAEGAEGFSDPGNFVLDVVVHALRLWQYCDSSKVPAVIRQSIHEYGHRANRSSSGPVNLRGNIVEAMTKDLQKMGTRKHYYKAPIDAVEQWVEQTGQASSSGAWRESWSSQPWRGASSSWESSSWRDW